MSDLNKKNFYSEVLQHIEEIEALFEDHDFEVDATVLDEDSDTFEEDDALVRFINHIKDAKNIVEENS